MAFANSVTTTVDMAGRIVIPQKYREALGMRPGAEIVLKLEDGELRLFNLRHAWRQAQKYVCTRIPTKERLADELIRERRKEAKRE